MDDLYLSLLLYYRSIDPDSIEREELWGPPSADFSLDPR
jgi:hypothetical protein